MLSFELTDDGIVVLTPQGRLEAADFTNLAASVDPWIEAHGNLRGVMVAAESFPGWADLEALVGHIRFVRDHHLHVRRIAAVSDSGILKVLPAIARHFVNAEVRHFPFQDRDAALAWIRS